MTPGVVIVGAGHSGVQLAASLREVGYSDPVRLVEAQDAMPYQRPPLSKELLAGAVERERAWLRPATFYETNEIDLRLGARATTIATESRRLELSTGDTLAYTWLVLATGSRPRALPLPGIDLAGVQMLHTIDEAERMRDRLRDPARVVVVGAGFIGLEAASIAAAAGADVVVLEAFERSMARAVSAPTASYMVSVHEAHGTTVRHGTSVAALCGDRTRHVTGVETDDGEVVPADLVLVAAGVVPAVELAEAAGLIVDDGVVVDAQLVTSDPAVFAVGDCASFPSIRGHRMRIESVQNATAHARRVARAICGEPVPPPETPWFWSTQHDARLQIAGLTAGHDRTVMRGDIRSGSFSVFCWARDAFLGAESINRSREHLAVRRLLGASVQLSDEQAADVDLDLKSLLTSA